MTSFLLHLYPFESWSKFAPAFRAAKPADLPELTPVAAYPGCGRLIGLGEAPPFVADYAVIRHGASLAVVADVLRWYCGKEDPRAITYAGWLTTIFGKEVREL